MTSWPRWNTDNVEGLASYVLRDEGAAHGVFPAKSDRPALQRLERVYAELATFGIRYEHEPVASEPGRQVIRAPHQVLDVMNPAATCLDVCLVGAGLCLNAGLHPLVLVADSHALLAVWIGRADEPSETNWDGCPGPAYEGPVVAADHVRELGVRATTKAAGAVLVVDLAMVAIGYSGRSEPASFEEAVENGAELVAVAPFRVCDVGVRAPEVFVHSFRSFPYSCSGVFVHPWVGAW